MLELTAHEIRGNLVSGKMAAAFFLLLLALLISLGLMHQEYERRMDNFAESLSMPGHDLFFEWVWFWLPESGGVDNSNLITFPMGKVKRPDPLLYFSRGVDKQMRQSVEFIATFPIVQPTFTPEQESNLLRILFEAPDYQFVVKILASLLALLFSYNLICEERERGTLKLILVARSSRSSVFLGKFLGGFVALLLAFTAAFAAYALLLSFITPVQLTGEVPARIALIFASSLLYVSVFYTIGAAVSAFTRSSAPAFVLALFIWFLFVFVLPGLSSLVAQQFVSVDSEDKVQRMKLEKAQEMERAYSEAHPESDSHYTAGYGVVNEEIQEQIHQELEKIEAEHQRRKEHQMELTTSLARVSPSGSLAYLLTGFARSGIEDLALYREQTRRMAEDIRVTLRRLIDDPEFLENFNGDGWNMGRRAKSTFTNLFDIYRDEPFDSRPLSRALADSWLDFVLMFAFAVVAFLVGYVRFLFYDPR